MNEINVDKLKGIYILYFRRDAYQPYAIQYADTYSTMPDG